MNLQALFADGALTPQTLMLMLLPLSGVVLLLLAFATGGSGWIRTGATARVGPLTFSCWPG